MPSSTLPVLRDGDLTVDPRWLAWVRAFYEQTPHRPSRTLGDTCYQVLTAARWLRLHHPQVTEPRTGMSPWQPST